MLGLGIFKRYKNEERGAATTEFVVVSFPLLMIIFFIVELTLLYFNVQASQKAAEMGVRTAIVSDPAVLGLPTDNGLVTGSIFGSSCSQFPSPCTGFSTSVCQGGGSGCDVTAFNRIVTVMQRFLPGLQPENVTITYTDQQLGFAGGPLIPSVTVAINGVPYQTGIIGRLLATTSIVNSLPTVSVTLTGEDLSTSGS